MIINSGFCWVALVGLLLNQRTKTKAHFVLSVQKLHYFSSEVAQQSKNTLKIKHFLSGAFMSHCRRDKGKSYLRACCPGNSRRETLSRGSKLQSILGWGLFRARRMQTAILDNFRQHLFKKAPWKVWYSTGRYTINQLHSNSWKKKGVLSDWVLFKKTSSLSNVFIINYIPFFFITMGQCYPTGGKTKAI